ncbi:MAG: glycosyltransferase family 4 protein [Candidatus Aenigmarchaeota archaeon]|nr:glycosyltransferase family 4 protein [Candidatus Aenigmarchaeota archaeon]
MIKKVLLLSREIAENESVSEYVKSLAVFLAGKGIEVHIVCFSSSPEEAKLGEGIHVHKVPLIIHGDSLFNWSMLMNNELKRCSREIFEWKGFDIIHGNDWITSTSAISLAKFTEKPLIVTIHSTEKERGFGTKHSSIISDMEWWLTYEAGCVLSNNERTYQSLRQDLQLPEEKIKLINPLQKGWQAEVLEIYENISGTKVESREKVARPPSVENHLQSEITPSNEQVKR